MSDASFADQVSSALERVNTLRARAADAVTNELITEALEELATAFEELRVAQEELRVQNESLVATEVVAVAERDRYRDLFEFAPSGYLVTDPEGTVRQSNRAARELLRVPAPRYLPGKPLTVFVAPEDRGAFLNQLTSLRRAEPVWTQTLRLQPRPEGSEPRVVELTVVPFRDPETREPLLRWQLRDVTEQWAATEALRKWNEDLEARVAARTAELGRALAEKEAAERRLMFLLETGEELASSLDFTATLAHIGRRAVPALGEWGLIEMTGPDGVLQRFPLASMGRAAAGRLWEWDKGRSPRTAADLPARVLAVPDTADPPADLSAAEADRVILAAALGWRSALWLPLAVDGTPFGALAVGSARPAAWGETEVAVAVEFARRVALALRNADLVRQLHRADRKKDEFLATLAHELRNPLTPLLYGTHILRQKCPPESEYRKSADMIERQARQIVRLVDDLMDVSRVVQGKVRLDVQPVDLTAAVRSSAEPARERAADKGVELSVHAPKRPVWVRADPGRLDQMLTNLLTNAVKYTDRGGSIGVRVDREGDAAAVRVRDTGVGIAPEYLPHVFDLFVQSEVSLHQAQGGLGIGLHLVKQLAELHGGSVEAASEGPGAGSEFVLRLPIASPPAGEPVADTAEASVNGPPDGGEA